MISTFSTIAWNAAPREGTLIVKASPGKISLAPAGRKSLHTSYSPLQAGLPESSSSARAAFSQSAAVGAAGSFKCLEVHDIDPANVGSLVAASTVLFDGLIVNASAFCNYASVNASNLQCAIAFTRFLSAADTEVRSALPGSSYRTRLVGGLSEGAECTVISGSTLDFFPQYVLAPNEVLEVHYRGAERAMARVTNPASISAQQTSNSNGVYGTVIASISFASTLMC